MFNMKVFCVLFVVLLNTIGNQGDPNQGLKNFEAGPHLPRYIVSMRNNAGCHICTGSIISTEWILSSLHCHEPTHILHGLREYGNCIEIQEGNYRNVTEMYGIANTCRLYQVAPIFDSAVELLYIPRDCNTSLPETGAVVGWSFDINTSKFVMNKIADINTEQAFSNETNVAFLQELCKVGTGSPLIYNASIYGILACSPYRFQNILSDVIRIHDIIKNNSQINAILKIGQQERNLSLI